MNNANNATRPKIDVPDWLEELGRGLVAAARVIVHRDDTRRWVRRKLRDVLRRTDTPGVPEGLERILEDQLVEVLIDRWFGPDPAGA